MELSQNRKSTEDFYLSRSATQQELLEQDVKKAHDKQKANKIKAALKRLIQQIDSTSTGTVNWVIF